MFNFSGPSTFPETAYISSRVTQGGGAAVFNFADYGAVLAPGLTGWAQFYWGDYTAVAPAGIGGSTPRPVMWFAGMFTTSGTIVNWATEIGKNGFTSPDQP